MRSVELRQKRAGVFEQMKGLLDATEKENRDLSGEEQSSYSQMETEFDSLSERIDRQEKQEKREKAALETLGTPAGDNRVDPSDPEQREKRYDEVFMNYVRRGIMELSPEEREVLQAKYDPKAGSEGRALSSGTNANGGFTVPTGFVNRLYEVLEEEIAMRAIGATVITTASGEDLPWPKVTAYGANASITPENTAIAFVDDTFDEDVLKAYTYPTGTKVSWQLLQDSAVDLVGFITRRMGVRISRAQNAHFVSGNGAGQPEGLEVGATLGKTGAGGQTTSIIADDLIDLHHSIKRGHRRNAKWLMNDDSVKIIRKLKDGDNQYLWRPGLTAGEPDTLLGKPVFTDDNIASMAAEAKSVFYGDFREYIIRDVSNVQMRRLDERFADALQTGFIAWLRSDGLVQDANAIKFYQNAAS